MRVEIYLRNREQPLLREMLDGELGEEDIVEQFLNDFRKFLESGVPRGGSYLCLTNDGQHQCFEIAFDAIACLQAPGRYGACRDSDSSPATIATQP